MTNPINAPGIRPNPEFEEIRDTFEGNKHFSIISELATTFDKLYDALALHEPNIVHFIGHGKGENGLVLENSEGKKHLIQTDELIDIFKEYSQDIECLFLNACHSMIQAKAIASHIRCTIGMQGKIKDDMAREFARKFYYALRLENNYEKAFRYAHKTVFKRVKNSTVIPQIFFKDKETIKNKPQIIKNKKSSPYLQIELFKKEIAGKYYTFRAWLYIASNNVKEIKDVDNITLNDFSELIKETLESITSDLAAIDKRLTIEFFLSKDLLNYSIEHYCPPDDFPIGKDYKVVIRSWDRTRIKPCWLTRCCYYWNSNKEKLQATPKYCAIRADTIEKNFCLSLKLDNGIIFFVLTSPPTKQVLIELIKEGVPIILWFRVKYSEQKLQQLRKRILTHKLEQLPELIRKIRVSTWENNNRKHTGYLSLLWEDTDRLPPDISDNSSKESHLAEISRRHQNYADL